MLCWLTNEHHRCQSSLKKVEPYSYPTTWTIVSTTFGSPFSVEEDLGKERPLPASSYADTTTSSTKENNSHHHPSTKSGSPIAPKTHKAWELHPTTPTHKTPKHSHLSNLRRWQAYSTKSRATHNSPKTRNTLALYSFKNPTHT